MQVVPELKIQNASCQPVPGSDGTLTLDCGATLYNPGPHTLEVLVLGATPGQQSLDIQTYTLHAGFSRQLPQPPVGGFWVIAYQSRGQIRHQLFWQNVWSTTGTITLYGLAGAGAGSLIALGILAVKQHQGH